MTATVDEYTEELTAVLRGPSRAKARLVEEIRDGLADTTEAYVHDGVSPENAARLALREFGTVEEIAPSCQRELTIAQARHTARAIALIVPLLLSCWFVLWHADPATAHQLPRTVQILAVQLGAVAATAALLAALTLVATGSLARRLPTPSRLPQAVAWTGTTAAVTMGLATLTFAIASLMAADWPLVAAAAVLAAAAHATIAASARVCRECSAAASLMKVGAGASAQCFTR